MRRTDLSWRLKVRIVIFFHLIHTYDSFAYVLCSYRNRTREGNRKINVSNCNESQWQGFFVIGAGAQVKYHDYTDVQKADTLNFYVCLSVFFLACMFAVLLVVAVMVWLDLISMRGRYFRLFYFMRLVIFLTVVVGLGLLFCWLTIYCMDVSLFMYTFVVYLVLLNVTFDEWNQVRKDNNFLSGTVGDLLKGPKSDGEEVKKVVKKGRKKGRKGGRGRISTCGDMYSFHHLFHTYNSYIYALLVMVTIALAQRLVNGEPLFTVYSDKNLEAFWTLCPSFILFGITWPSLWLIHYVERPRIGNSFEVVGNQWYWAYRAGAHNSMPEGRKRGREFDSMYINGQLTSSASSGGENMWFISSNDVIHNWGIAGAYKNSLGMKMDAYPGRLNVAFLEGQVYSRKHGVYLGYCSELCGLHHAYMPISLVFRISHFFLYC